MDKKLLIWCDCLSVYADATSHKAVACFAGDTGAEHKQDMAGCQALATTA